MKYLVVCLLFFVSLSASGSLPIQVSDEELINNTDHLIVGHVIGVEMIDGTGREITDLTTRTGPGLTNTIRLIVEVENVILTNVKEVPHVLRIPLDRFMHFSLGQIKEAHTGKQPSFLLLLKGPNFETPFPGIFERDLKETEKIIDLMKSKKALQNNPSKK